jgi:hypothetical protein
MKGIACAVCGRRSEWQLAFLVGPESHASAGKYGGDEIEAL